MIKHDAWDFHRVNFYRNYLSDIKQSNKLKSQAATQAAQNTTQAVQKTTQYHLNESEQNIINIISMKPTITQNNIADLMGISLNNVKYYIKRLRKKGVFIRTGTNQKGKWIVKM